MGMAKKAQLGVLIRKTGRCRELVKRVLPPFWLIESRVDNGEVFDLAHIWKFLQPLAVVCGELFASPLNGFGDMGIAAIEMHVRCAVFVVIALDARGVHGAHDINARFRIGAIPHKVPQKNMMRASLFFGVFQNCPQSFQVCVNVGYDRELHFLWKK
jgi:hypothetical protein